MTASQLRRRWHPDTLRLMPRMERAAVRMTALGPRSLMELLLEIGVERDCLPYVAERLDRYSRMDLAMVRAVGADRIAPLRLALVPSE